MRDYNAGMIIWKMLVPEISGVVFASEIPRPLN
jgi:hypothetical protein